VVLLFVVVVLMISLVDLVQVGLNIVERKQNENI